MTEKTRKKNASKGAVVLTVALLVIFAFVFVLAFIISSTMVDNTPTVVNENSYLAEVNSALEGADPAIGEQLIEDHTCVVCHVLGNGTVAPLFAGVANRAGERHEPLGPEQYLYESIMYPGRFVVPDYTNSMPNNFKDLLTQQEIGHIIAYLMTLTEEPEAS